MQFIDSLKVLGAKMHVGSIGKTAEGRDIPFVVVSNPLVTTPEEAKRLHRPIVYVQANIHAGEVEGKEALQALLRDLLFDNHANVLDSLILIAVPIYNADGNERFADQARNRSEQNGPELVGTRANAQGFDLNRDYIKAEAPETVASLAMFRSWDPDVFVDLHTTDGSYHGYALTYAASLNPAAIFTAPYTRDTMLVDLRKALFERHGFYIFDYGNFPREQGAPTAWETYDSRPRFGTNYYGLRGRLSVLSEAYSHDPFVRRVAATYDFVAELLSYVAGNADDVIDLTREADSRTTGYGNDLRSAPSIPIRSKLATIKSGP
ncbi:MAG TPA: M14 family metallopeptidase, partial [Casimicrobiaceae bacterium]|nr:M14 family metallopeptidase [Casimicrobiaceae bacterium]